MFVRSDERKDYGEPRWQGLGIVQGRLMVVASPNENQTRFESFHYERRTAVKKISSKMRSKTNWTRVDSLSDRDIDYSDIPELD